MIPKVRTARTQTKLTTTLVIEKLLVTIAVACLPPFFEQAINSFVHRELTLIQDGADTYFYAALDG